MIEKKAAGDRDVDAGLLQDAEAALALASPAALFFCPLAASTQCVR